MLIVSLAQGATLSIAQMISFGFIGAGLIVFSIAMVKKHKAAMQQSTPPAEAE